MQWQSLAYVCVYNSSQTARLNQLEFFADPCMRVGPSGDDPFGLSRLRPGQNRQLSAVPLRWTSSDVREPILSGLTL